MGCSPHSADYRCVTDATSLTATLRRGPNPLRGEAPAQRSANPLRILFLVSDEARFVTGMQLRVDAGGYLKWYDYKL